MRRIAGLLLAVLVAACGGESDGEPDVAAATETPPDGEAETTTSPRPTPPAAPAPGNRPVSGTQGCLDPADAGEADVAWQSLSNPILDLPDQGTKDQALRFVDGRWHLLFSHLAEAPDRSTVGQVSSADMADWTEPSPVEADPDHPGLTPDGWPFATPDPGGVAVGGSYAVPAPDVTRRPDGTYVGTFQTRNADGQLKLYYRTSTDLTDWTSARPLAHELRPAATERVIDAGLAHTDGALFLAYKLGQTFELAVSPSGSLDGPWEVVGQPSLEGTPAFENYQFLPIDGVWHLLGTSIPVHRPLLYRMVGDPADVGNWLRWEPLGELEVPSEEWNSGPGAPGFEYERANSAYLCDATSADGWYYLLYAGSSELQRFAERGDASIGIARSRDLRAWEVP